MSSRVLAVASAFIAVLTIASCIGTEPDPTPTATLMPSATSTPAITPEPAETPAEADSVPVQTVTFTPTVTPQAVSPTSVPNQAQEDCTREPDISLTHYYTDLEKIEMINPTIVTSGNWLKNRQYHKIVTDSNNVAAEVPIYAPADAVAIELTHYIATMYPWNDPPYDVSQFEVRFQISCDVSFAFDHITKLAEPFASLAPDEGARDTRNAAVPISVVVPAGSLIGWSTGTDPAHVWDFIMTDLRTTTLFANQERYENHGDLRKLLHAVCPYDYYDQVMQSAYIAIFAWWGGSIGSTLCGGPVDVPGALAGGWFQSPFDLNLLNAPVGWGVVAKIEADGLAYVAGPDWEVRSSPQDITFADPGSVTTEHCYEHYVQPVTWVYVKLLSTTQLAVSHGEGSCPSNLPPDHIVYYR